VLLTCHNKIDDDLPQTTIDWPFVVILCERLSAAAAVTRLETQSQALAPWCRTVFGRRPPSVRNDRKLQTQVRSTYADRNLLGVLATSVAAEALS
jgi:hypothetical protein